MSCFNFLFRLFLFLAFTIFQLQAEQSNDSYKRKTICLNMIVKDESKVITRCLASVKKIIDYWVIVDTGSSDGTQNIIKEFMKDIPGELHERPWVNFGHNRNEALQFAKNKGDYVLFIDADEFLVFEEDFKMPHLDKDKYFIYIKDPGSTIFIRSFLINNKLNWNWEGVIHEVVSCPDAKSFALISKVINQTPNDGHRSEDPKKNLKDIAILEKALEQDPTNARYRLYLGLNYFNAKDYLHSLQNFEKRTLMGGEVQEVSWSLYMIARNHDELNSPQETIINSYCKAFQSRPSRAEPLYCLGRYYNKINQPCLANIVLSYARLLPIPNDGIFIQTWIYNFGIEFEQCISLFYMGRYKEAYDGFNKILTIKDLPLDFKKDAENNLEIIKNIMTCPQAKD
ncbi:MAG: glycosyltransferase [Chlamydiae bacterium]|nr:glycosyltransferase [Chlamydiota bacterium]